MGRYCTHQGETQKLVQYPTGPTSLKPRPVWCFTRKSYLHACVGPKNHPGQHICTCGVAYD